MKKHIIAAITITACVTLCAVVWPRNAEVEDLPAEPVKNAVITEIEVKPKETPPILLSADTHTLQVEAVAESEQPRTEIIKAEEKTESLASAVEATEIAAKASATTKASIQSSYDPTPGTIAAINGVKSMCIPGFGWVKDEGGGSVSIPVDGEGNINRQVGVMGGGTMVGNPGDQLTGNKVGIMGGGIVAEDMYENGHKIGIMGGSEPSPSETSSPASGQLEPVEGEINIVFVEVPEKNSTPPPYKPGEVPTNP